MSPAVSIVGLTRGPGLTARSRRFRSDAQDLSRAQTSARAPRVGAGQYRPGRRTTARQFRPRADPKRCAGNSVRPFAASPNRTERSARWCRRLQPSPAEAPLCRAIRDRTAPPQRLVGAACDRSIGPEHDFLELRDCDGLLPALGQQLVESIGELPAPLAGAGVLVSLLLTRGRMKGEAVLDVLRFHVSTSVGSCRSRGVREFAETELSPANVGAFTQALYVRRSSSIRGLAEALH